MNSKILLFTASALTLSVACTSVYSSAPQEDISSTSTATRAISNIPVDENSFSYDRLIATPILAPNKRMSSYQFDKLLELVPLFKAKGNLTMIRKTFFNGAQSGNYEFMLKRGQLEFEQNNYLEAIKWTLLSAQTYYDSLFSRSAVNFSESGAVIQQSLERISKVQALQQKKDQIYGPAVELLNKIQITLKPEPVEKNKKTIINKNKRSKKTVYIKNTEKSNIKEIDTNSFNKKNKELLQKINEIMKDKDIYLKSKHLILGKKVEWFLTQEQIDHKRVFLLSLCPASLTELSKDYETLARSHNLTAGETFDLFQNLGVARGQSKDETFSSLISFFETEKELKNIASYLMGKGEKDPYLKIGKSLYKNFDFDINKMILDKEIDLEKILIALYFFEKSNTPEADLYYMDTCIKLKNYVGVENLIFGVEKVRFKDEIDFYQKIYDKAIKGKHPILRIYEAEIVRYGQHGQEPDIHAARIILETIATDLKKMLKEELSVKNFVSLYSLEDILSSAHNNLGSIYQFLSEKQPARSKISYTAEERNNFYNLAKEMYAKSDKMAATESLSELLKGENKYEEAIDVLKSIQNPDKNIQIKLLDLYQRSGLLSDEEVLKEIDKITSQTSNLTANEKVSLLHLQASINSGNENALKGYRKEMTNLTQFWDSEERAIAFGRLELQARNFEVAFLYFSKAALSPQTEAVVTLSTLEQIWDGFPKEEGEEHSSDEEGAETSSGESSAEVSSEDTPVEALVVESSEDTAATKPSGDTPVVVKKLSKTARKALIQARKKEKESKKIQKSVNRSITLEAQGRIEVMKEQPEAKTGAETEKKSITYYFSKDEHLLEFEKLSTDNKKFKELLSDIENQPWATTGSGKPEVLKNLYKGEKGCISRRLDHKNRLVYKVMGPGEIKILGLEGHYE